LSRTTESLFETPNDLLNPYGENVAPPEALSTRKIKKLFTVAGNNFNHEWMDADVSNAAQPQSKEYGGSRQRNERQGNEDTAGLRPGAMA
jgi:hypothetical protein